MTCERPTGGDGGANGDQVGAGSTLSIDADCWLCERRPRARGWEWCARCLRDTAEGIRRRRKASYRLPLLDCGRRDPLDDIEGVA